MKRYAKMFFPLILVFAFANFAKAQTTGKKVN